MNKPQNIRSEIFFGIFILLFSVCQARADQSSAQDGTASVQTAVGVSTDAQATQVAGVVSGAQSAQIAATVSGVQAANTVSGSQSIQVAGAFSGDQSPRVAGSVSGAQSAQVAGSVSGAQSLQVAGSGSLVQAAQTAGVVSGTQSTPVSGAGLSVQPAQTAGIVSGAQPVGAMPKPSVQGAQTVGTLPIAQPQFGGVGSQKFSFQFAPKDPMWPLEWHLRISDEEAQKTRYDLVLEEVKEQAPTTVAVLIASKWIQAKEGDPIEFRFYINLEKPAPDGTYPFGFSRMGNVTAKNKVKAYVQNNWFSAALGIRNTSDIEIRKESNGVENRIELVRFKSLIKEQTKQFSISLLKKSLVSQKP